MEAQNMLVWTLQFETDIPNDIDDILIGNERPIAAYKTLRDSAVFTDKRMIIRDSQGMTGKKVEMYSLPYSSIHMWSTENAAGMFDVNAELELWTRVGRIKINLGKKIDIRRLDQLIAEAVL
ncbi:PH domain-containing protein [Salinicoccus sp. ID82-1]|uniref:PH domain-containing protein n=1 Tax=Salinicoccus cyprini TaxID=2493691 RepID=A0A558AXN1_9STAP|nr:MULTISPECIES: PH domain-containing protein [Salinicoccus]MCG1008538.1 PH domain-containing protein [Salinicoccus sp. ID82-1]TVT29019.1 PH domain-containing protein [Salinicoccus cyprini]